MITQNDTVFQCSKASLYCTKYSNHRINSSHTSVSPFYELPHHHIKQSDVVLAIQYRRADLVVVGWLQGIITCQPLQHNTHTNIHTYYWPAYA